MPYFGDPTGDTMGDRLEIYLQSLLTASADLTDLQAIYRGDPGIVPVRYYPFGWLMITREMEATGETGYNESTGVRYFRYDGSINLEVLFRDVQGIKPVSRIATVPSYSLSKEFTQAAMYAIMEWGGPSGNLEGNPVASFDGKEETIEFRLGTIVNGLQERADNVSNRGSVEFTIFTRRLTY